MAKRVRIGDIAEIPTSRGLAYAQVSHKHRQWGDLLRILPRFFAERPRHVTDLVREKELFVVFFPLQAAVSRKILEIVGNEPVPPEASAFPVFRNAGFIDREGRVHDWWLWDGEREWKVGKLTEEQRKLPILEVINDTLLIERIEQGWTPEKHPAWRA